MQKRKMRGRVPRSLGSARHRTDGGGEGADDRGYEEAQPATVRASRARASKVERFMAVF